MRIGAGRSGLLHGGANRQPCKGYRHPPRWLLGSRGRCDELVLLHNSSSSSSSSRRRRRRKKDEMMVGSAAGSGAVEGKTKEEEEDYLPKVEKMGVHTDEGFRWTSQWYPVAVVDLLDPKKPHSIQLLGKNLVVWKDEGKGTWCCVEDVCPHRGAPLSEGKIWMDGSLMCSYHGWRFSGTDGSCVSVPQAMSKEAEVKLCSGSRSCAYAHPTQESQDLLWVWGEGGKAGSGVWEESEKVDAPVCEELAKAIETDDVEITYVMRPTFRDVPYDFTTAIENVADPAHVPYAHHGVQGNRENVKYGMYALSPRPLGGKGSDFQGVEKEFGVDTASMRGQGERTLMFRPPCRLNYLGRGNDGSFVSFIIFAVPSKPGQTRLITYATTTNKVSWFIKALKVWLDDWCFVEIPWS